MTISNLKAKSLIAFRAVIFVLAIFLMLFLLKEDIRAQGQSLSIYPPVIEVDATPPSSPIVPIVIQNNNSEPVVLNIELIPIRQSAPNGDVVIDPSLENEGFYPFYKDRIQFLDEARKTTQVTLDALETKELELNINLVEGDPPGDFYYAIVFISEGKQPEETSLSRIPAGIATNLLLSVGPRGKTLGGIAEFKTSFFKTQGPVEFDLKLHNGSKHLIQPEGYIEIEDTFGRKVANINILPQYILSNSDRYLIDQESASGAARLSYNNEYFTPKAVWKERFLMGIYKATAKVQLEENGQYIDSTLYFVAFPIYFLIGLAIFIFISVSIYLRVRRKVQ